MKNRVYNLSSKWIKRAVELRKWQFPSPKGPFVPIFFKDFFGASCATGGIDDNIYIFPQNYLLCLLKTSFETANLLQEPLWQTPPFRHAKSPTVKPQSFY